MKHLKLFLALFALVGVNLTANAQTDVTATYITNPGFDDGETGWTVNGSGTTYHGVAAYGSTTQINSVTNINVDKFGNNVGNAAFANAGWGDKSFYSQEITLPAGTYKFTFDVINRNNSATKITNLFGWVPNDGDVIYDSSTDIIYNAWQTLSVTFTLDTETTGKISAGMQSTSGSGSGAVAKLFIDNVKIFKMDVQSSPSIAKPIDYSDLINQGTWSVQQDDNTTPTTSTALVSNITSGDWTGRYVERYRGVAGHYGKALFQTITIPSGVYQVQAACMSSSANGVDAAAGKQDGDLDVAYFYANNEELTYPLSDKKGYYRKHIVTLDADGTIEFGINTKVVGANWNAIGCATLIKVANTYNEYIEDLLSESVAAWNSTHANLEALDATLLPDAAEQAITEELAKARPNTQEEMESAIAAMQALIDSYDGIKAAYDEYKALKAKVEDLKNTSKYTFTGTDALNTFNTTLDNIDTDAEAATDAETLTALLPDLRTAGNAFVGGIESTNGFDVTYNVINNSFETGSLSPWTTNGSNDTGVKPNSNGTYTTEGVDGAYLFNTWNNGAGSKVSQTLSNLPTGYYTVTALVASDSGNTINILAGATTKTVDADGTNGKTQFVEGTTDKTLVSDGSLEIGTISSTWYKADNFRLTFYTETSGARDAWLAAKAAAEAALANTDYENVTGSEKKALEDEIAKDAPSTAEAYGTATTALQEATSAFIDAKTSYDGLVAMRTTGGTYTTTDWPRAAAAKKTALDEAIAAEPTNAEDAVAKTNAIVTAYRQFVESNGMAEGVDAAVDYTSTYLAGADPNTNTGWTNGIGTDNRENEVYTQGDGTKSGKYYDGGWSTSAGVSINMTREITLPAGQYQLQITARGSSDLTSYTMSVGDVSIDLPKEGSGVEEGTFGHGWSDKYIVFESDGTTAQTLTIAATSEAKEQWISFNRFRLIKLDATLATAEDYAALNAAISAAEAKLGFEEDEYAPYNNVSALTKLAEAKAIDQNANNSQDDVQALTTYLNTAANWTINTKEVNAVYNGLFATVQEGANYPEGWTRTNAWGQMQSGISGDYATAYYNQPGSLKYGENGVYTMPLKANTAYCLTFAYRSHENNSNNSVTVSVLKGEDGLGDKVFEGNGSTSEWKTGSVVFKTGDAGNYVLTLANSGNTWMTNVSIRKAQSVDITVKKDFTATTYSNADYALDFSNTDGLTASIITDTEGTEQEVSDVPAGTGVFVKANPGTYKVYVVNASTTDVTSNLLVGTGSESPSLQSSESVTYYVYGRQGTPKKEAFYKVKTDKGTTVSAGKAYLKIDIPAPEAKDAIFVGGGDTTGINAIEGVDMQNGDIYNLQGQKVNRAQKGVYIVNGKKIVLK